MVIRERNKQEGSNIGFVTMAIESLFAFSGYRASGEIGTVWDSEHVYSRKALEHLITKPLTNKCASILSDEEATAAIEKCMYLLHSEAFSPTLIWNREMRGKVVEYVDERANDLAVSNFLEHDDGDSDDDAVNRNAEDPFNKELSSVKGFLHDILRNQILVGDVYLRPFVDQEDRLNGLNVNKFTKDLLDHLVLQGAR